MKCIVVYAVVTVENRDTDSLFVFPDSLMVPYDRSNVQTNHFQNLHGSVTGSFRALFML
jgi:hypothetical protein